MEKKRFHKGDKVRYQNRKELYTVLDPEPDHKNRISLGKMNKRHNLNQKYLKKVELNTSFNWAYRSDMEKEEEILLNYESFYTDKWMEDKEKKPHHFEVTYNEKEKRWYYFKYLNWQRRLFPMTFEKEEHAKEWVIILNRREIKL